MEVVEGIPPKLLHKSDASDVLLSSPKPAAPTSLPLEIALTSPLSAGAEMLRNLYLPGLNGVRQLSQEGEMTRNFHKDAADASESTRRCVPYQQLRRILLSIDRSVASLSRRRLSSQVQELIAAYNIQTRSTSFEFVNTADHYFFYRKPHEHVPGIMLLEAARQSIYYHLYTHTNHRLGEVTVSLSALNARFYAYAELMHPIEITVEDMSNVDSRRPGMVKYLTSFYQREKLLADVESHAPVINLDRFTLARNAFLLRDEQYAPLPSAPILALIVSDRTNVQSTSVRSASVHGVTTSLPPQGIPDRCTLTLVYANSLCFCCDIKVQHADDSKVEWIFFNLRHDQIEVLKEIIKRSFVCLEVSTQFERCEI